MRKQILLWLPVLLMVAAPLAAQTPTPEGTVITNTARVTFTDANGNTYAEQTASATVTVGFQAGVTVAPPSGLTTLPGATGTAAYTITNAGNGTDQFVVGLTTSAGLTVTGFTVGAATYADLAELNAALAAMNVDMGDDLTVTVNYSVNGGTGGDDQALSFTATSGRDGDVSHTPAAVTIEVPTAGVSVTADPATRDVVPGTYQVTFTVENTGGASYTFNLTQSASGEVSITDDGGMPASVILAAGASVDYTVTYSVANVASGTGSITLTAVNASDASVTDAATHTATLARPAISIAKDVTRPDGSVIAGNVLPGEEVRYVITVENTGGSAAVDVVVTDDLPAELEYVSHTATGWDSATGGQTVTATVATLAAGASLTIEIIARVR